MTDSEHSARRVRIAHAFPEICLAAIVLLALALRLIDLDMSLWYDEVVMHQEASMPFQWILQERSYPLCYLVVHCLLWFGDSEALIRIPNVVEGLLGVLAVYVIAKSLKGSVAAIAAALLLAVNPFHLQHSQDARFYAMLALAGLLAAWLLHRALAKGGAWYWAGFIVASWVGLMSHTFYLPYLGAMAAGGGVWVLLNPRKEPIKPCLARLAVLGLCILLGIAPSLLLWIGQGYSATRLIARPEEQISDAIAPNAAAQKSATESQTTETPTPPIDVGRHVLTVDEYLNAFAMFFYREFGKIALILIFFGAWGAGWLLYRMTPLAFIIASCLVVVPGVLCVVPVSHFYQSRYFIIALPLSILLIATGLQCFGELAGRAAAKAASLRNRKLQPFWRNFVTLGSVGAVLLVLAPWMLSSIRQYQAAAPAWDWKGAFQKITRDAESTDRVVFVVSERAPGLIAVPCRFYMQRLSPGTPSETIQPDELSKPADLLALVRAHTGVTFYLIGGEYGQFIAPTLHGEFEPLLRSLNAEYHPYQHAEMAIFQAPVAD